MSFSKIIKKKNFFLIPFSWMYKAGVFFYSSLYKFKILKSYKPKVKTICVGNLSVGGTGKSPMVEYLLDLLRNKYCVAVLSRGYKRKTNGFLFADSRTTVADIGDEPMQFHKKFPEVAIAVDENRAEGIDLLLKQNTAINVIVLDDAFQHRSVTAGLNILLTEYNNIFIHDWYLPAGSLRDLKSNFKRADIIVVTKTKMDVTEYEKQNVIKSIRPTLTQKIFFTAIEYGAAYNIFSNQLLQWRDVDEIILVTGIANPQPIMEHITTLHKTTKHLVFGDHHHFTERDIGDILGTYEKDGIKNKIILTTEKDAMRLKNWKQLSKIPLFALPISHKFLFNEGSLFNEEVENYLRQDETDKS